MNNGCTSTSIDWSVILYSAFYEGSISGSPQKRLLNYLKKFGSIIFVIENFQNLFCFLLRSNHLGTYIRLNVISTGSNLSDMLREVLEW